MEGPDKRPIGRPIRHRESREAKDALNAYLDLGRYRSLKKLEAALGQAWGGNSPSLSTLENWSSWFGWQRIAERHDAELAEIERKQVVQAQAEDAAARREERLKAARMLRALAWDGMLVEEEETDENDAPVFDAETHEPRRVRRPARFKDLSHQQIRSLIDLLRAAAETERLDYAEIPRDEPGQVKGVTKVLGPEAIQHLKEQVYYLVQEIRADAEERKKLIDQGLLETEPFDPDEWQSWHETP